MTDQEFAEIWKQSRTVRDAAHAAGLAPSGAHGWARSLGLPPKVRARNRPRTPEKEAIIQRVRALRADGHTLRDIAASVGKSLSFAHRHGRGA